MARARQLGFRVAPPYHRLDAGPAGRNERELGGHEERVRQDEQRDDAQPRGDGLPGTVVHVRGGKATRDRNAPHRAGPVSEPGCVQPPERPESARALTWALAPHAGSRRRGGGRGPDVPFPGAARRRRRTWSPTRARSACRCSPVDRPAARRPPRRSFGYYRLEILAALFNGALLIAVTVWIVLEAVRRLHHPPAIRSGLMLAVAVVGLAANLVAVDHAAPGAGREPQHPGRLPAHPRRHPGLGRHHRGRGRHPRRRLAAGRPAHFDRDRRADPGQRRAAGGRVGRRAARGHAVARVAAGPRARDRRRWREWPTSTTCTCGP